MAHFASAAPVQSQRRDEPPFGFLRMQGGAQAVANAAAYLAQSGVSLPAAAQAAAAAAQPDAQPAAAGNPFRRQPPSAPNAPATVVAPCYAVVVGRVPGLYSSWADAQQQITGFPRAHYKKFKGTAAATAFLAQNGSTLRGVDAAAAVAAVDAANGSAAGGGGAGAAGGSSAAAVFISESDEELEPCSASGHMWDTDAAPAPVAATYSPTHCPETGRKYTKAEKSIANKAKCAAERAAQAKASSKPKRNAKGQAKKASADEDGWDVEGAAADELFSSVDIDALVRQSQSSSAVPAPPQPPLPPPPALPQQQAAVGGGAAAGTSDPGARAGAAEVEGLWRRIPEVVRSRLMAHQVSH